jgi:hypothetical protein
MSAKLRPIAALLFALAALAAGAPRTAALDRGISLTTNSPAHLLGCTLASERGARR